MSVPRLCRIIGAAATAVLLLSACGDDDDTTATSDPTADPTSDSGTEEGTDTAELDLVSEGTLTVCSDVPYPPLEVEDPDAPSGYSGFDIDLMQEIADRLGLDLAVQDVGFDPLQSGAVLAAGQCDVGASAMTITEDRKENLDFSDSYYDSLQSLLVPADSGITAIDGLAGETVAVQQGTTGERYAQENVPDDATVQSFPSDAELWAALQAGNVAGILQDFPPNYSHQEDDPSFTIVETYETDEQYGFAFAKGEKPALLDAVNEQLQAMRDDGTYDELHEMYFAVEN